MAALTACLLLQAPFALAAKNPQAASSAPAMDAKTLLSGSLEDVAMAVAVDSAGNRYVTGWTSSPDFPGFGPATFHGGSDAFVTKLSPSGTIQYTVDLGGIQSDGGTGIVVDARGDVYVAGSTQSSTFPTTPGAVQTAMRGGVCPGSGGATPCDDAFVAELGPTGTLIASTLLGGNRDDGATGIALDAQDNVYVTGWTNSRDFPVVSPIEAHLHGKINSRNCNASIPTYVCTDAFVTKLSPDLRSVVYSTYLGGTGTDQGQGIAVDSTGAAIVVGTTQSPDFPLAHPLQRAIGHSCRGAAYCQDGFVAKLAPSGKTLLYSTYLGGSGSGAANGVAIDAKGDAYIAGYTTSANFPQVHPLEPKHTKGQCTLYGSRSLCPDMFLTKLDPTGRHILYSSHFGGFSDDVANSVAVDRAGNAYVVGYAGSYNFPTLRPIQKKSAGGFDQAIVAVSTAGNRAFYSTYMGGEGDDYGYGVAVIAPGRVVVAGSLDTVRYTKPAPYRGQDALVFGIDTNGAKPAPLPCLPEIGSSSGC